MSETLVAVLVLMAIAIVPIVPAFVLYKYLDKQSAATAEGPAVYGLKVKLGGPAAVYALIFVALLYERPRETQHFHTWTVEGVIAFEQAPDEAEANVNDVVARVVPPRLTVFHGGGFSWEVAVTETDDGRVQFPDLQLDARGFRGVTVPMGPNRTYGSVSVVPEYDMKHRRITFKSPIVMQSVSVGKAYFGSKAQAAAPVATPVPALAVIK